MRCRLTPLLCIAASTLSAQQAGLQFDVASVHASKFPSDAFAAGFRTAKGGNRCSGGELTISGTRVSLNQVGICEIIALAYGLKGYQIVGVPPALGFSGLEKAAPLSMTTSIAEESKQPAFFYDIEARAPGPEPPTRDQAREMLRGLLADRFHLAVQHDQRELSYYALAVPESGSKLKPAAEGCKPKRDPAWISMCGQTVERLVLLLDRNADRIVLDKTGLAGKFDFEFPVDREQMQDFGYLAAQVQQELKLKVEARKGPIDVLVVDRVERPGEN